jgi:hypothetical protein
MDIGYRHLMRGLVRQLLVLLLTLSFAVSGVAARQCDAAHHSAAVVGVAQEAPGGHQHHDHAAHGGSEAQAQVHDLDVAMVHQSGSNPAGTPADDHLCAKCCGLCTLAMGVTTNGRVAVIFAVSSAAFSDKPEYRAGAIVKVDPGIPKLIV